MDQPKTAILDIDTRVPNNLNFYTDGEQRFNNVDYITDYEYPCKVELLEFEFEDQRDTSNLCLFIELRSSVITQIRVPLRDLPQFCMQRMMDSNDRCHYIDNQKINNYGYKSINGIWFCVTICNLSYTEDNTLDDKFLRENMPNWRAKFRLYFEDNITSCNQKINYIDEDSDSDDDDDGVLEIFQSLNERLLTMERFLIKAYGDQGNEIVNELKSIEITSNTNFGLLNNLVTEFEINRENKEVMDKLNLIHKDITRINRCNIV
jgi:hypothetical protein